MDDGRKSKEGLIQELTEALKRIAELEEYAAGCRLTEQALSESEEKYRLIVENAEEGIGVMNIDGINTFVNKKLADMLGYTAEEMTGISPLRFIDPEYLPSVESTLEKIKSGTRSQRELKLIRKDGRTVWVISNTSRIVGRDNTYVGILGMFTNITERKKVEEALRMSEENFRRITENISDTVSEIDSQGVFKYISPSHQRVFGLSSEDLLGRYLFERVHPDDLERVMTAYKEGIEAKTDRELEFRYLHSDGNYIWIRSSGYPLYDASGEFAGAVLNSSDITERKKAEEALRQSEERFRRITENMSDIVNEIDSQGNFKYISPSHRRIIGENPEDLIGRSIFDGVHPDDLDRVMAVYREGIETRTEREAEFRYRHADGSYIWMRTSGRPLLDASGEFAGAILNSTDITERKKAEEALNESEEKFRRITENMSDAVCEIDPQGFFTYASPSFGRVLGVNPEDLMGKGIFDGVHLEDLERVMTTYREGVETRTDRELEFRYRHADGSYLWIRSSGQPLYNAAGEFTGAILTGSDITERKAAEEELQKYREHLEEIVKERTSELRKKNRLLQNEITMREQMNLNLQESEAKYRFLAEKMSDVIWTTDANLKATYVSPSIEKVRGFTPEERLQMLSSETMTPESYARALETFAREVERDRREGIDPEKSIHIEFEYYHKNGSTVWMDNIVSAIYDDAGNLMGVHGVGRDITERKRAEEEKKRLENQLMRIQKIEALDRFACGIAHDLNNMLYPIIINTEHLLWESPPDSSQSEILHQNLKALYRQRDLIKKILTFSREHDREFSPTRIMPLLEETFDLLRSSLPSTIDIQYLADVKTDVIMGDSTQIQQIIMNLCQNAADALESGKGTIEISLTDAHLEPMITHQPLQAGEYLQLAVKDTGHGMRPQVMDRIFEPFFTTKVAGKGTGMGLSVVHGIVKNHGGAITVQSEEGKGSAFTVYLPICDDQCQAEASFAVKAPFMRGRGRILLVDDEELILFSLQRVLKLSGYRVIAVNDSREALRLFEKKSDKFDLVITDLTMPGMTGVELTRRLLDIRPDIPVVLCTGFNDVIDADQARSLGIRDLLHKPAGTGEIRDVIRRVLEN